ncbi:MAG: hypothetical protein ABFC80_03950 [Coriobacteriales bacterium]|nr:cytochrome C [Actinomycetes bacterium]
MKLTHVKVTPFWAGLVLGVGAALVQAYFNVFPPVANGFCMICHPRDFFDWIANRLVGVDWPVSLVSTIYPLMTVVGVVAGAVFAAWRNKELRFRRVNGWWKYVIYGFLSINFGLLLAGCPIRIVLLSAYGSPIGFVGWASVAVGATLMTLIVRWWQRRAVSTGGDAR